MARTKSDNVQINISIPAGWKTELENLARIYSAEEGESIIFLAYWNHGCSAVFPCNIISFLHFIKLFSISFSFNLIFRITIQKQ